MQVHRFSNRLKTSLWGNKSKYPRFPIHSTLLLPNTISFPKASCNLRTCEAVFAVKSSSMFTFLFSMFTFSRVNVHFFRFFKSAADVQYPVMKRMILVQQEIAKEYRCRSGVDSCSIHLQYQESPVLLLIHSYFQTFYNSFLLFIGFVFIYQKIPQSAHP